MRTPAEVIQYRAECYASDLPSEIFRLYAENSEFRNVFTDEQFFCSHFAKLKNTQRHAGLKIVKEREKGNLAEVTFIEYFHDGRSVATYYSRAVFTLVNGAWKITKETRETAQDKDKE